MLLLNAIGLSAYSLGIIPAKPDIKNKIIQISNPFLSLLPKNNGIKTKLENWLISSGIDTSKLKLDNWCLGNRIDLYDENGNLLNDSKNDLMYNNTAFYYGEYIRLYLNHPALNSKI